MSDEKHPFAVGAILNNPLLKLKVLQAQLENLYARHEAVMTVMEQQERVILEAIENVNNICEQIAAREICGKN